MAVVILRSASAEDESFLWAMLAAAADWRPGAELRSGAVVRSDTAIAHYVAGWPRRGDFGVIAEDDDQAPVGAVWCRFFETEPRGYGFVAADVPELSIGVIAARRGEGIGRMLLAEIIAEAGRRGVDRISLSVEADNPAIDLYVDVGFIEVGRITDSPTMVLDCTRQLRGRGT